MVNSVLGMGYISLFITLMMNKLFNKSNNINSACNCYTNYSTK